MERVQQRVSTDQLIQTRDFAGSDLAHLCGDGAVIDHYVIGAVGRERGALRSWRVVAKTVTPRSLAIVIAAMSTDEVPPWMSSESPDVSRSSSSEPHAVPNVSGIAPSVAQSSAVSPGITCVTGRSAYC